MSKNQGFFEGKIPFLVKKPLKNANTQTSSIVIFNIIFPKEEPLIKGIIYIIDIIISGVIIQYLIVHIPNDFSIYYWIFSFSPIVIIPSIVYLFKKRKNHKKK